MPAALAYLALPTWAITLGFAPCLMWSIMQLRRPAPEPSIDEGRLELLSQEFETFHLHENAIITELDVVENQQSIRLNFLALQEAMTLANISARQLQDFLLDVHATAAQTEFMGICGLLGAAQSGADGQGSMHLSQETLRMARQAQAMHQQADQVLSRLVESNQSLMGLIEAYLLLEEVPESDQAQQARSLAERIRRQCRNVQNDLRQLEPGIGTKRWAGLQQILMVTRNATGAVMRSSDQLLSGISAKAG